MSPVMPFAMEILMAPVSFCQKPNTSPLLAPSPFASGTEGPAWKTQGAHIVLTLLIRLLGVDDPYSRQKQGISI